MTLQQLENWCEERGMPAFRARQVYEWLWKKGIRSWDSMANIPEAMRSELRREFILRGITLFEKQQSADGTLKVSFMLHDGAMIESVLIPSEGRTSVCVSTQAGCPLACRFCATGNSGFARNLSASEIYDQFAEMNKMSVANFGMKAGNIIYMGMGEPLLNYEATISSIAHITGKTCGLNFSPQRITVSTAGIVPGIERLGEEAVKFGLAVSLHTANQKKREELMPVAAKYPLEALSEALKTFCRKTGSRITIEYLLLDNFNDDLRDFHELAVFCRDFPVKVNIIEYNQVPGSPYQRAKNGKADAFRDFLHGKNMLAEIRKSRGGDISAACGQLAKVSDITTINQKG